MKVSGYGTIGSTSNTSKKQGASSVGNFSDLLSASEAAETAHTGGTSDIAATSALNNLLALQEISEQDVQRRKLLQQGKNMLDVLEQLRRQILSGTMPASMLQDLGRQLSLQKQEVMDPALIEIIEDIELRTAVELAKLEMAFQPPAPTPHHS
jgi:hypothetical protein